MNKLLLGVALIFLSGCLRMQNSVTPVKEFNLDRYLGKWYEIARLDHFFERGLEQVTAEYSLREGGGVLVKNRGFSMEKSKWSKAEGKAFFAGKSSEGHLKVSFIGPFYSSYVVFELDKDNYQYAFVSGPDKSYRWLLARIQTIEAELLSQFIEKADKLVFETDKLIYVKQK